MVFRSRLLLMFFFFLLMRHQHTHTRRQGVEEGREENFSSSALRTYSIRADRRAERREFGLLLLRYLQHARRDQRGGAPLPPLPTSSLRAEGGGGG